MTTRIAAAFLMLLAAGAASSASAEDKTAKGDLDKLKGTWMAKFTVGADDIAIRMTFEDKAVRLAVAMPDGNEFETKGEFSIDEQAKPHKTIDFRNFKTPDGDDLGRNEGIYAFEDADTLKLCGGGSGNARPTEFKSGEGGPPHLLVMKREKQEKATEKDKDKADAGADAAKGDLAKFQGKWTTKVGPNKELTLTVTFKANAVNCTGTTPDGQEFALKGEIKLDEKAKPNKTIDWVKFTGPQGNEAPDNLGIYEVEAADTIRICNGGPGNERPTEFKDGDGGQPLVLILKREKD